MSVRRSLLLVLDGAGFRTEARDNAVTPVTLPSLFATMGMHGFAVLEAAGPAVGLEDDQVGNSEAGHLTIGAGEIVPSTVRRLQLAWQDGSWQRDPAWARLCGHRRVHVVGLLSAAGVHALARTLVHAATLARQNGAAEVVVHPVLDGVDSPAGSAPALLAQLRGDLAGVPGVHLGVVQGRKPFCDRSGDHAVSEVAAAALCGRVPLPQFADATLQQHLQSGRSEALFAAHQFAAGRTIAAGEPVLLTSHRADRARQIATVLAATQPLWTIVDLGKGIAVEHVFFPQQPRSRGLAHELRRAGIASLRVAEKCKFPHVTHFLNGLDAGCEGDGCCVPSIAEDRIAVAPEMSVDEITDRVVEGMADPQRRAIVANFANLDQVGHLGQLALAQRAAACVDRAYQRIAAAAEQHGWSLLVTADHGNAEVMADAQGRPFGSHTGLPVPFFAVPARGQRLQWLGREGSLANVAATFLDALGATPPDWMHRPLLRLH